MIPLVVMRLLLPLMILALLGSGIGIVNADEDTVRITEVMWDGVEYLEIYNYGDEDIELSDWKITRQKPGSDEQDVLTFQDTHTITSRSYFLIEKNEEATTVAADAVTSSLTLVNTGEVVRIYNGNSVVDSVGSEGMWPAGKNTEGGVSMEKGEGGWQDSTGSVGGRDGTPREANSSGSTPAPSNSQSPQSYTTSLLISEFLPNPTGEDTAGEYIELHNPSSDAQDISGWKLDDASGGSTPYTIPNGVVVAGNSYIVFKSTDTKIALNNTSDSVRLLDPSGAVQQETSYASVFENQSYNRQGGGGFVVSTTLTPGSANVITTPAPSTSPTPKASVTPTPKPTQTKVALSTTPKVAGTTSAKVIIWRVLPDPVGKDEDGEYIELKNEEATSISIAGWFLDDEDGGSQPYEIPEGVVIAAGQTLSFLREETGIALNNPGDTVRLLNPNGDIVDELTYEGTNEGEVVTAPTTTTGAVAGTTTSIPDTSRTEEPRTFSSQQHSEETDSEDKQEEGAPEAQVALAGGPTYDEPSASTYEPQKSREGVVAGILLVGGAGAAAFAYGKPEYVRALLKRK